MKDTAWILEVMDDMLQFARMNSLPGSAAILEESLEKLREEIQLDINQLSAISGCENNKRFSKQRVEVLYSKRGS
jgi:hypothetical protein